MSKYTLKHTGYEIDTLLDKANVSASVEYVDNEIATFDFIKIVDKLPETGLPNRLYFIPKVDTQTQDLFDEYAWIDNKWEWITTKQMQVDLTPYYTKTEVDNLIGNAGFTQGMILMWSGSITSVPTGWALCDGTNGTPNLCDRFIVGAGSTYDLGATGGSDSVTLTVEQMPSHNHKYDETNIRATNIVEVTGAGYYDILEDGSQTTTTTTSTGGGKAHENRPPYYALAYIMKL